MVFSGIVVATMFTWWTPVDFLPAESVEQLSVAQATQASAAVAAPPIATLEQIAEPVTPTAPPPPPSLNNIGIVSGHRGIYPPSGLPDPGAVCPDGLTEREVNEAVATRVGDLLVGRGYAVDLLDEFDERLTGYQALALVSIHADTCEFVNELATGYKVASFSASRTPEADERLVRCLSQNYEDTTGLSFHPSITFDMTQYHNFREVNPSTPAAIIEIGFMYLDRELLTEQPDTIALGITRGILCFLDG
ncbi:MAG: N-acetylmuramoyl-L-alanine amidase [Anaerolineae bacterium]